MKIKIALIDDEGKEFTAEAILAPVKSHKTKSETHVPSHNYEGLKGGIKFLIDNGLFNNLKSSKEVQTELKKENYFHSIPTVDRRLRFLVSKKQLTRIKEDNVWKYALRK